MGLKMRRFVCLKMLPKFCSEGSSTKEGLPILALVLIWLLSSNFHPAAASDQKGHLIGTVESAKRESGQGEGEGTKFIYQRINCLSLLLVRGERSRFRICYPPKFVHRQSHRLAYVINGPRDNAFEQSFKRQLLAGTKLKVFTLFNASAHFPFEPDLAENVEVQIYAQHKAAAKSDQHRVVGIKDLMDTQDDYHAMEFIKYEMHTNIDPIVFSVNIPVFAAHLLLRLKHFSGAELRRLIQRLGHNLYFPYAIDFDRRRHVHFVSLMHKNAMYKYNVAGPTEVYSKWHWHGIL